MESSLNGEFTVFWLKNYVFFSAGMSNRGLKVLLRYQDVFFIKLICYWFLSFHPSLLIISILNLVNFMKNFAKNYYYNDSSKLAFFHWWLENTKTNNLINLNQQEVTEIKRNQIKSKAQTWNVLPSK